MRAREAKYRQLEMMNATESRSSEEFISDKPFDPYEETDFRTPASARDFSPGYTGKNRFSMSSGTGYTGRYGAKSPYSAASDEGFKGGHSPSSSTYLKESFTDSDGH